MYSLPAFPNNCRFLGVLVSNPLVSRIMSIDRPMGGVRSVQFDFREPGLIFSKPMTRMQSAMPPLMSWRPRKMPEEPVEQALLTL